MTKTRIHLAHIGLLDAAPLLVACEQNYFSDEGLDVVLSCELGLATIAGKLAEQKVDGACLPAVLPLLLALGAGVPRIAMDVAAVCAWQGLAVVRRGERPGVSRTLSAKMGVMAPGTPARVFLHKLAQASGGPAITEPTLMPMAASQMVEFLREGMLDGFCACDPLPALARLQAEAELVADSAALHPNHPCSVVAVRSDRADTDPSAFLALSRAVHRALDYCSVPSNRSSIWELVLSLPLYDDLDRDTRSALKARLSSREAGWTSMRFDLLQDRVTLSASSENFLESVSRGLIGPGAKTMDIKGEIARSFRKREALQAARPVGRA